MTAVANAHMSKKPGKRERNKAEKRRRIIEAAGRLFEEKGFEATTTAEISAAADVGTGLVGAPAGGDVMKLQLQISDEGIIEDAKFKTFGCGSAIASSSLVTEMVKGKSVEFASTIRNTQIAEELSLPPVKIHCSVLAEDAIKAAIADYRQKQGISSEQG